MPTAEIMNPPPQQQAATTAALRGPSRSTQAPNSAADEPRNTKNSVYIHPSVLTFQSSGAGLAIPIARPSGSQKTLKPYAIPIDKWIASAAGGTSHRLNPGGAMMQSFASRCTSARDAVRVGVDGEAAAAHEADERD